MLTQTCAGMADCLHGILDLQEEQVKYCNQLFGKRRHVMEMRFNTTITIPNERYADLVKPALRREDGSTGVIPTGHPDLV